MKPYLERSPAGLDGESPRPSGRALDPRHYLDAGLLEREHERIFERTWQLAGHVSQLPLPGSYTTATAGRQPVLVVRDEDGALRAFRNVCRHRASRLLSGEGTCRRAIRCRYHGWTYRLDGTLVGVPEHRRYEPRLDKRSLGLHPVRVETLCGLVFVNLDADATPLRELTAGLPERLAPYGIPSLVASASHRGGQPANWKVVAENYLEGYHIPIAHPGLMRLLDYQRYEIELHESWVWFEAPLRDRVTGNRLARLYDRLVSPAPGLGEEHRRVWRYVYLYPNTAIDLYPDHVSTWQILPDGTDADRDVFQSYRHPRAGARTRAVQAINHRFNRLVLDEDVDLVDNVQQGLRTRGYTCGPLSTREAAVGWFADRIRADLAGALEAVAP